MTVLYMVSNMLFLKVYRNGSLVQDWKEYKGDIVKTLTHVSGDAEKVMLCLATLDCTGSSVIEGITPSTLESFKIEIKSDQPVEEGRMPCYYV